METDGGARAIAESAHESFSDGTYRRRYYDAMTDEVFARKGVPREHMWEDALELSVNVHYERDTIMAKDLKVGATWTSSGADLTDDERAQLVAMLGTAEAQAVAKSAIEHAIGSFVAGRAPALVAKFHGITLEPLKVHP